MISLEALISRLEVGADPFALCEVRARWEATEGKSDSAGLYFALRGEGTIEDATGTRTRFGEGCIAICPPRARMWIEPANAATERPQAVICRQLLGLLNLDVDSSDAGVAVACGAIHATFQQSAGLFDHLREPIVEDVSDSAILKNAFPELAEEMRESRPGTAEIVSCILKRCLIGILRRLLVDAGEQPAWLLALENPRFGRVLAAMLDRPAHAHTLESLADIAGMSRSVFAQQFSTAFNRTAMSFLREIRLRRAARQLQATNLSVKAIAAAAGFRSRSYFWRVFKELHGVDPAGFRTRCQANR